MSQKTGYSGGRAGGGGAKTPSPKRNPEAFAFAGRGKALERALNKLGVMTTVRVIDDNNVIMSAGGQEYRIHLSGFGNNAEIGEKINMGEIQLNRERGAIIPIVRGG